MKLAIKGHPERGKEVLNLLKSLGGKEGTHTNYSYEYKENLYYINKDGKIDYGFVQNPIHQTTHKIYTLEEFEELYPFKVGNKVHYTGTDTSFNKDNICTITGLHWNHALNKIFYILDNQYQCTHKWMTSMKQKELKDYLKPGYVIENKKGNKHVLTQDVHGNVFGVQLGKTLHWTSLTSTEDIVAVYQIDCPSNLHLLDTNLTKVWERKEVELTMQEIADMFGISVDQLKIKK